MPACRQRRVATPGVSPWAVEGAETGTPLPRSDDDHGRIVRLIAERARLPIIEAKVRPVALDPQSERAAIHRHLLAQILRDIEGPGFFREVKDNAAFVSILRLGQLDSRAAVSPFHDFSDVLLWRFGKGEDRFFDFDLGFVRCRVTGDRPCFPGRRHPVSTRWWPVPC